MKRNARKAPFQVGQRVRFLAGNDVTVRTVEWISKGAETRGDQLISTDAHGGTTGDATLYTEVEDCDEEDIILRLKAACVGHPTARIPWPHRLLHDAIAEIERLRA